MISRAPIRRGLALSVVVHAVLAGVGWWGLTDHREVSLIDIDVAPKPPPVELLPPEKATVPEADVHAQGASTDNPGAEVPSPGDFVVDAGVDAPIDAAPRKKKPDAAVDAGVDDATDAGVDDAIEVAMAGGDAGIDASGSEPDPWDTSGSGAGGSGSGSGSLATEDGSGSGKPGTTDEVAVDGAPTTAGTAANLLAYFPKGHTVTALIRFDRMRNTEWLAQTERLLRPMPDYRVLFGPKDAQIGEKLDTLVISTPRPRDATATTLVAHTHLSRAALRDFLGKSTKIAWSPSKGGMLGRRTGPVAQGDRRLFMSPFRGWFLFAQPTDLGGLSAAAGGNIDLLEATGKLPPWLAGIRKIESESGDKRGPALVLTIGMDGSRFDLGDNDFGLGVKSFPTPTRVSLAMELVKQGWLIRGNIKFASDAAAQEFLTAATTIKDRITKNWVHQTAIAQLLGKAAVRLITNFSFARTGARVSYTTSISISDARALMAAAATQLDSYYGPP